MAMTSEEIHVALCGCAGHGKSSFLRRLLLERAATGLGGATRAQAQRDEIDEPISGDCQAERGIESATRRGLPSVVETRAFGQGPSMVFAGHRFTFIDNGAAESVVDSVIYGLHLADAAIVVIEVKSDLRRDWDWIIRAIYGLRVPLLAICITKMDSVYYAQERFADLKREVQEFIGRVKSGGDDWPPIIPVSSRDGVGFDFVSAPDRAEGPASSSEGPSVAQVLRTAAERTTATRLKPLRVVVGDHVRIDSANGQRLLVVADLVTGHIRSGDVLLVEGDALGERAVMSVVSVQPARQRIGSMASEDGVTARAAITAIVECSGMPQGGRSLRRGSVLSSGERPMTSALSIRAIIVFFETETPYSDREFQLTVHDARVNCRLVRLDGDVETLSAAPGGVPVSAVLNFEKAFVIEPAAEALRLGRFELRREDRVVGCGVCIEAFGNWTARKLFRS